VSYQSKIKGVIFDIGGVLAHDVWEHLLLSVPHGIASKYNLSSAEVEKVGKDLWKKFATRKANSPQDREQYEREYWETFKTSVPRLPHSVSVESLVSMSDSFVQHVNEKEMSPILTRLQGKGIGLAMCSNNNEFWFHRQMTKLGLSKFFDDDKVVLSCWEGVEKSDKTLKMFHAATKKLELTTTDCLFIDDRVENINRAIDCGMTGIWFPSGSSDGARYLNAVLVKLGL
jgi:HAD superfamily hydrolase (TIGR01509 family)